MTFKRRLLLRKGENIVRGKKPSGQEVFLLQETFLNVSTRGRQYTVNAELAFSDVERKYSTGGKVLQMYLFMCKYGKKLKHRLSASDGLML